MHAYLTSSRADEGPLAVSLVVAAFMHDPQTSQSHPCWQRRRPLGGVCVRHTSQFQLIPKGGMGLPTGCGCSLCSIVLSPARHSSTVGCLGTVGRTTKQSPFSAMRKAESTLGDADTLMIRPAESGTASFDHDSSAPVPLFFFSDAASVVGRVKTSPVHASKRTNPVAAANPIARCTMASWTRASRWAARQVGSACEQASD